jgi:hypothetical protein
MGLIYNTPYYISGDFATYTPDRVSIAPKLLHPQFLPQFQKVLKYLMGRHILQYLYRLCRGISEQYLNKYTHFLCYDCHRIYRELILFLNSLKCLFQILRNFPTQYVFPVLEYPHPMILQIICSGFCPSNLHTLAIQEKTLHRLAPLPRLTQATFLQTTCWRVSSGEFYEIS